jgi:transcriptional regulator with XRE-family HTH domain
LLDSESSQLKVSTGLSTLDEVLGGLYWGDNVVWDLAAGDSDPFYAAITGLEDAFDTKVVVSLDGKPDVSRLGDVAVIDASPSTPLAQPIELLHEIQRRCGTSRRRLLLFDSLDAMVKAWGANSARGFFARCCPFLLEVGAIAYWTMSTGETPTAVRETVHAVTQCVLRVDERAVRVVKAEGREDGVTGTMLHWHFEDNQPVLEPASVTERVAASLRALRRNRELNQHQVAGLAGVTASAISQAERAERGLSLSTLARLTSALGVTIDDLIRGEDPDLYRIGRRVENPEHGPERAVTILGTESSDLRVDLVQLPPREEGTPMFIQKGSGIIAVAKGLVQVRVAGLTPAVRHGEVLVADTERVEGWRNLGQTEAVLFWIVISSAIPLRPHREH